MVIFSLFPFFLMGTCCFILFFWETIIMSRCQYGYFWLLSPPLPFSRSSGQHPVSAQDCCMYVRAGRPAFARPREGVHWSTSLTSSSLLLLWFPAWLVRLILILFVTGGWWPYSCCFVGCCLQDLFNIVRSFLV